MTAGTAAVYAVKERSRGRRLGDLVPCFALLASVAAGLVLPACAPVPSPPGSRIQVVAAENFWGSIARQIGGTRVTVTSVINNPSTDPHDYEPTVQDARSIATARLVVENGVGYDPWADRLLAANPDERRIVLDVGKLAGVRPGGNPHLWYEPSVVHKVAARIAADYKRLDPRNATYFDSARNRFETVQLAEYDRLIAAIRSKYAGTRIGGSESIVSGLAPALGLDLITPASFLNAISEGSGPTAADKATVDAQIRTRQIEILIYNRQNSSPDVVAVVNQAKAVGIPVVAVTETLEPSSATFQDWQTRQLREIEAALHRATGR